MIITDAGGNHDQRSFQWSKWYVKDYTSDYYGLVDVQLFSYRTFACICGLCIITIGVPVIIVLSLIPLYLPRHDVSRQFALSNGKSVYVIR